MKRFARAPLTVLLALALFGCGSPPDELDAAPPEGDGGRGDAGPSPRADSGPPADVPTWTLLVYMASDNNLEESGIDDLREMMALPAAAHLNVIVQIDRAERFYELGVAELENWTGAKRLRVRPGDLEEIEDLGEVDTGAPEVLQGFLEWGLATYPADHVGLILWNHGHAWRGYGGDDVSDDQLSLPEITSAIAGARTSSGLASFDFIGFDACLMGDLASTRILADHTRYVIASEDLEPSHGWDYGSFEELIDHPEQSPEALGREVLSGFRRQAREERRHMSITLSLLDLQGLDALEAAVETFAGQVRDRATELVPAVARARADLLDFGRSADLAQAYHSVDLALLAERLAAADEGLRPAAQAVVDAVDAVVLERVDGRRTEDARGVAIYFPPQRTYYDAEFDAVDGFTTWRAMLTALYEAAEAATGTPGFDTGGTGGPGAWVCGNGVCEATLAETPADCAVDCGRTGPTYDFAGCDTLPPDPGAPATSPRTRWSCVGDGYATRCTWGADGRWVRDVRWCGASGRMCAEPGTAGGSANPNEPCVVARGQAVPSCTPGGEVALSAPLDPSTLGDLARVWLRFGFHPVGADEPLIVGQVRARVDAGGMVDAEWDQRLLTVEQSGRRRVLFAESVREDAYTLHEVPVVYTLPVACPCDLPGDGGYADTDGDRRANCLDDDDDGDGVPDEDDNCPFLDNADQADSDGDSVGDACELDDNAPVLSCTPDPAALFGERQDAYLHVITNGATHESVSWSLYVRTPLGTSQIRPAPGSRLWPRTLHQDPVRGAVWDAREPLPMNLRQALTFVYHHVAGQLVLDENGLPVVDEDGTERSVGEDLALDRFFLELVAEGVNGQTRAIHFAGDASVVDPAGCEPQEPALCPAGQVPDCVGVCYRTSLIGDGVCHGGGAGPNFRCEAHAFDRGDCTSPGCPAGRIRDCDGRCLGTGARIGDGTCDAGANPVIPNYACELHGFDGGDCPCGPNCNGHGTCVAGGCMCTGGYGGTYCELAPSCGDGTCGADESCRSCAADCGACPPPCGNGICEPGRGEDCTSCVADCGACACGDGRCAAGTEDCTSCAADCGACPACGDAVCTPYRAGAPFTRAQAETCASCPLDCGACQHACCSASEDSGTWGPGGGCGDAAVTSCVCAMDPSCCELGWPSRCRDLATTGCGLTCCTPSCSGRTCGPDGCGGLCGSCGAGTRCNAGGTCDPIPRADCCDPFEGTGCSLSPACEACVCGADAACCGTAWGPGCSALAHGSCNADCGCGCVPDCDVRTCGPDGCGGDCGSCGAGESCSATGSCVSDACAGSTADCNGLAGDGCEVDLSSDAAHCGTCGRACLMGQPCIDGSCASCRPTEFHETFVYPGECPGCGNTGMSQTDAEVAALAACTAGCSSGCAVDQSTCAYDAMLDGFRCSAYCLPPAFVSEGECSGCGASGASWTTACSRAQSACSASCGGTCSVSRDAGNQTFFDNRIGGYRCYSTCLCP